MIHVGNITIWYMKLLTQLRLRHGLSAFAIVHFSFFKNILGVDFKFSTKHLQQPHQKCKSTDFFLSVFPCFYFTLCYFLPLFGTCYS